MESSSLQMMDELTAIRANILQGDHFAIHTLIGVGKDVRTITSRNEVAQLFWVDVLYSTITAHVGNHNQENH